MKTATAGKLAESLAGRSMHGLWRRSRRTRGRGLREAVGIAVGALLPALGLYAFERNAAPPPGAAILTTAQAVPAGALWIDARSETDYRREHIPGALNLNEENWPDALGRVFETWQPPRPIFVYCSAGCSSAERIARRLTDTGIEPVQVFEGGFEKWKQTAR